MALDQIWKQQLTLVTYGNEFLKQHLSFNSWINHSIFNQHTFSFRDLNNQHLLAQHFQIWLEGLKHQGVTRLSLHNSSLLLDEKNPNPNVELLPYAHFIVSHHAQKKIAWICGKELAEWYNAEHDYSIPQAQQTQTRMEIFWRFELPHSYYKRIDSDLKQPNWEEIDRYTQSELFQHSLARSLVQPIQHDIIYSGLDSKRSSQPVLISLLPERYLAPYAHQTLARLEQLDLALEQQLQQSIDASGHALAPEQTLNIRHFQQKLQDLTAKFITKVANHYQTAQIRAMHSPSPFDDSTDTAPNSVSEKRSPRATDPRVAAKNAKSGVFTLILITVIICLCAYYFGL